VTNERLPHKHLLPNKLVRAIVRDFAI